MSKELPHLASVVDKIYFAKRDNKRIFVKKNNRSRTNPAPVEVNVWEKYYLTMSFSVMLASADVIIT